MRVALISPYPPKKSGIATYCSYLTATLGRTTQLTVIRWNQEGWTSKAIAPLTRILELWRACRAYHVVHVQYHPGDFLPLFLPTLWLCKGTARIVVTIHEDDRRLPGGLLLAMWHRLFMRCADNLIVHTDDHRSALPRTLAERTTVIPHGIILRRVSRQPTKGLILLPGFINPWKGQDLAIRAMPAVLRTRPDARLHIVGRPHDTQYAASLHALIDELGLAGMISITEDYVPDPVFYSLLRSCEIAVLPYRDITMSGILCHVISWQTPCVCTDIQGVREATEQQAVYCDPTDSDALARAITRLLGDRARQRRMSAAFAQTGRRNSWQRIAQRTRALYEAP